MSCASFLLILSLLRHSILDLGSGTGQTDSQTDDGHQSIMPHPMGARHNLRFFALHGPHIS